MPPKFYFFTDLDALYESHGSGGQQFQDGFGNNDGSTPDKFMVSTVFIPRPSMSPKAYSVCQGQIMIHKHPTAANHGTIVLKPFVQPNVVGNVDLPKIKYIIYRGVKFDSIIDPSASTHRVQPFNTADPIDLLEYLRDTNNIAPPSGLPDWNVLLSKQSTLLLDTPVSHSFRSDRSPIYSGGDPTYEGAYPLLNAGMSIGKFHETGFSLEIIFENPYFEPTLKYLQTPDPIRSYIEAIPLGTDDYSDFISRYQREKVRHFLDPAAFYGAFYGAEFGVRNTPSYAYPDPTTNPLVGVSVPNDDLSFSGALSPFYNQSVYYIDIRNQFNNSFNLYTNNPDDLFPKYDDLVSISIKNKSGATPINLTRSYYSSDGWPILKIRDDSSSSDFPSGSIDGEINLIRLELDKGNNNTPKGYLSNGYFVEESQLNDLWGPRKPATPEKRFMNMTESTDNANNWAGISLAMPIQPTGGIVTSYSRVYYVRKVNPTHVPRLEDEDEQFDNYFLPFHLLGPELNSNNLQSYSYDDSVYVNLNGDGLQSEFYGGLAVGIDQHNISLSLYASNKQRNNAVQVNGVIPLVDFNGTDSNEFLAEVAKKYTNNSTTNDTLSEKDLLFDLSNHPQLVYFTNGKPNLTSTPTNYAIDDLVTFVIDKANYAQLIDDIQAAVNAFNTDNTTGIDSKLPISILLRARNDRDDDVNNDYDENPVTKQKYVCFEIYILGFHQSGTPAIPTKVQFASTIKLYGKATGSPDNYVSGIFIDKDTRVDLSDTSTTDLQELELNCELLFNELDRPTPQSIIENGIDDAAANSEADRYFLDNPDVQDLFSSFYKEDLVDFITKLYAAAVNNISTPTAVKHGPSFMLYKYVFSKLIKTNPVTGTTWVIERPLLSTATPPVIQLNFDPTTKDLVFKTPIVHQGLLLEACNQLSIFYISKRLKLFYDHIIAKWLHDRRGAESSSVTFTQLFNLQLLPVIREFPFLNNLIKTLESLGLDIPGLSLSTNARDKYEKFFSMFIEEATYNNIVERTIDVYQYSHSGTGMPAADAMAILKAGFDKKQEMLNAYTKSLYTFFGGTAEEIDMINVATGDGSTTVAIFGGNTGISLLSYQPSTVTGNVTNPINIRPENIRHVVKNFTSAPAKHFAFHIGLYGAETPSTPGSIGITDHVTAYRTGLALTPDFNFSLALDRTITYTGSPAWTSGTGLIGNFINSTKDLIFYDLTVDQLDFNVSANFNEMTRFLCFYRDTIPQVFYAKSYESGLGNDQFILPGAIWPAHDPNLQKLVHYIKDADGIELTMKGGFIGKKKWPAIYKPQTDPYPAGHTVFYGDSVYKSSTLTSAAPPNSPWVEQNFDSAQSYQQNDFVIHASGLWRATTNIPTGAFIPAQWQFIAELYDPAKAYFIDDKIFKDGAIQKCVFDLTNEAFNQDKWIHVHRLESDNDYRYNPLNNWSPVVPEVNTSPTATDYVTKQKYTDLRSTMGTIWFKPTTNKVIIDIESYASPRTSALMSHYANSSVLDLETIFGKSTLNINASIAHDEVDPLADDLIPSYNQVLTALRCWGLLDAFLKEIQDEANYMNDPTGANDDNIMKGKLDALRDSVSVPTLEVGPNITTPSSVNKGKFNTLKTTYTP